MVEAKWGTPACVLQGLRGESLIVPMDEAAERDRCLAGGTWGSIPHLSQPGWCWPITELVWDSLELAEDVSIFSRDAGRLQDGHAEGEGAAQAEVVQGGIQGPV